MEEDLEFHPLFDKFKKYSVQDDDVRVIQYHKLADSLRLIGIILVIDGHIEKLMAKYCPKYIPKEQQVSKVGCRIETATIAKMHPTLHLPVITCNYG